MASKFSDYFANAALNWFRGDDMPAAPDTVYIALHTGDCGVNGTGGVDVTTTIRVAGRVAVDWGAVTARQLKNDAVADFGDAAGTPASDVGSASLWDAPTGGNCLTGGPLPAPLPVTSGLPVKVPVAALVVGLTVA
jgi:hypothetical protein